nr:hypothetical protein Iba_chr09eCG13550 [Ipomoea batatas]
MKPKPSAPELLIPESLDDKLSLLDADWRDVQKAETVPSARLSRRRLDSLGGRLNCLAGRPRRRPIPAFLTAAGRRLAPRRDFCNIVVEPSILEHSISSARGSLPLVIRSQPSPTQDNDSDSSSTWIEDDSEGEDAGRRREPSTVLLEHIQRRIRARVHPIVAELLLLSIERFDFQPLQIIKSTSTLRIEEIQESDTKEDVLALEASEAPETPSVSTDVVTLQVNADAALAQQLAQEELIENMAAHSEAFEDMPSHEEIFRRGLARMYNWQEWRMSSLQVIGETISEMAEEEEWALD